VTVEAGGVACLILFSSENEPLIRALSPVLEIAGILVLLVRAGFRDFDDPPQVARFAVFFVEIAPFFQEAHADKICYERARTESLKNVDSGPTFGTEQVGLTDRHFLIGDT
jgi:hypothetical protein